MVFLSPNVSITTLNANGLQLIKRHRLPDDKKARSNDILPLINYVKYFKKQISSKRMD